MNPNCFRLMGAACALLIGLPALPSGAAGETGEAVLVPCASSDGESLATCSSDAVPSLDGFVADILAASCVEPPMSLDSLDASAPLFAAATAPLLGSEDSVPMRIVMPGNDECVKFCNCAACAIFWIGWILIPICLTCWACCETGERARCECASPDFWNSWCDCE